MYLNQGAVDITLRHVKKHYDTQLAVNDISLNIAGGQIVSLLGPSGCGKTTTLRMIAGLESIDSGTVSIGKDIVNSVPTWRRDVGMVFQSYALFPHMTVKENVAFGLQVRKCIASETKSRVAAALELVHMTAFADRMPSQLSGGQRQRVALARALVTKPKVLLLDEPLAALDKKMRETMQHEIKQLQRQVGITTIVVTHDQEEALTLSDRIVVMNQGKVEQEGTPLEIYQKPPSHFVSDFIGLTNACAGVVSDADSQTMKVDLEWGLSVEMPNATGRRTGDKLALAIRPERIAFSNSQFDTCSLNGNVTASAYLGAFTNYEIQLGTGHKILAQVPETNRHGVDDALTVGKNTSIQVRGGDFVILA